MVLWTGDCFRAAERGQGVGVPVDYGRLDTPSVDSIFDRSG